MFRKEMAVIAALLAIVREDLGGSGNMFAWYRTSVPRTESVRKSPNTAATAINTRSHTVQWRW